jgi:hypothetical protein
MNEPDLESLLQAAARDERLPDPPLDRIWNRVETRVFGPVALQAARRRWAVPMALAAMLMLGVALGYGGARLAAPAAPAPAAASPAVEQALAAPPPAEDPAPDPFVGVAGDYLEQTTALLVAVAGDHHTDPITPGIRDRARELLSTTRLLLDAGVDQPALHDLLEDLELVLAQVARMPRSRPAADSRFVSEALDQSDVLPRLTLLLADTRGVTR